MIAHHFADIFEKELDEAGPGAPTRTQSVRVLTFSDGIAGVEDVGARLEEVVTYHDSCHALRELKIKDGPRRCSATCAGSNCAKWILPRSAADSAERSP